MTFISHAQNFEDVMLWRALKDVPRGCYIDVGAGDPDRNTITRAFYERGWSGVNIEPEPAAFEALVRRRERDVNLRVALADLPGERRLHVPSVPGLATLQSGIAFRHRARGMEVQRIRVAVQTLAEICRRHAPAEIHFLNIDVEGAEQLVLQGADFAQFRPWIVLAEATVPLTREASHAAWEPLLLAADYRFVWFDGLNRFYVAQERHAALAPHFALPPNVFDGFRQADAEKEAMAAELLAARAKLERVRGTGQSAAPGPAPARLEFDTLYQTALALFRQGRHDDALAAIAAALALRPEHGAALYAEGTILLALHRWEAALARFDRALAAGEATADLLNDQAVALIALGRLDAGLAALDRAVMIKPDHAEAHNNRGTVLQRLGRLEAALECHRRALLARPPYPEALNDAGAILRLLGRADEALASHDAALALKPDDPSAHLNRGLALRALERPADAVQEFTAAIDAMPGFADAYVERAIALQKLLRHRDALLDCDRAIDVQPDHAGAHWTAATSSLALGDFRRGWREYEWRWPAGVVEPEQRAFAQPLWLGSTDLDGRTLLVRAEQGFGDILQFCRYVPMLAERCRVVLEVPGGLVRLLCSMDQGGEIVAAGQSLPDFDLHCPLLSLPLAFGTTLATIPAQVPYLRAAPDLVERWRRRLSGLAGLRVGLAWAGRSKPFDRSVPGDELAPLRAVDGVSFVSLQKRDAGDAAAVAAVEGISLHDWTDELADFADTAALIEALDLVISIDTAAAHLAGALGKDVWLMNRFDGCWRWMLGRDDSPWYPTLRLLRQPTPGDWASVVRAVVADLAERAR